MNKLASNEIKFDRRKREAVGRTEQTFSQTTALNYNMSNNMISHLNYC